MNLLPFNRLFFSFFLCFFFFLNTIQVTGLMNEKEDQKDSTIQFTLFLSLSSYFFVTPEPGCWISHKSSDGSQMAIPTSSSGQSQHCKWVSWHDKQQNVEETLITWPSIPKQNTHPTVWSSPKKGRKQHVLSGSFLLNSLMFRLGWPARYIRQFI